MRIRVFEQQSASATVITILSTIAVVLVAMLALSEARDRRVMASVSGFSIEEIWGMQKEARPEVQGELNRLGIEEVRRRVDSIEGQRGDVRMAVIEAKLDTLFDVTRMLVSAAIIYIIQTIGSIVVWFGGKRKSEKDA